MKSETLLNAAGPSPENRLGTGSASPVVIGGPFEVASTPAQLGCTAEAPAGPVVVVIWRPFGAPPLSPEPTRAGPGPACRHLTSIRCAFVGGAPNTARGFSRETRFGSACPTRRALARARPGRPARPSRRRHVFRRWHPGHKEKPRLSGFSPLERQGASKRRPVFQQIIFLACRAREDCSCWTRQTRGNRFPWLSLSGLIITGRVVLRARGVSLGNLD